jgi:hypothetical protein
MVRLAMMRRAMLGWPVVWWAMMRGRVVRMVVILLEVNDTIVE